MCTYLPKMAPKAQKKKTRNRISEIMTSMEMTVNR